MYWQGEAAYTHCVECKYFQCLHSGAKSVLTFTWSLCNLSAGMAGAWSPFHRLEESFNDTSTIIFMGSIWQYSFYISIFYVVTIFSLRKFMQNRPKYNLRGPLMVWSLLLASFSFCGFSIGGVHLLLHLLQHGWKSSVCDPVLVVKQTGLWSFLFCFSKLPELVDTYFIVLRKQKLIFLHWYHHITVFMYCWFSYAHITNPQQWFISMNYFVHSIMYFYYAVRASSKYRPPVWVNVFITSLQLLQMVVGVWLNVYVYFNMRYTPGWYCDGKIEKTNTYVYLAFVMYFSYFLLFAHFFYNSYVSKKLARKGNLKQSSAHEVMTSSAVSNHLKMDLSQVFHKMAIVTGIK